MDGTVVEDVRASAPAPPGAPGARSGPRPGPRDGEPSGTQDGAPTYLVALRHAVVAQDIAQAVAEFDPEARVIVAPSPPQAVEVFEALEGVGRVVLAFVGEGPRGFGGSPLARALASRGARVVLMGGEAEAEGEAAGFTVLARPFAIGAVMALLAGARAA